MRGFPREQSLFLVCGESMRPTLRPGDIVRGREVRPAALACGDIVVYLDGAGRRVIHRIVSCHPLRTQGDNRLAADRPVPPESPLWLATHRWRGGRLVRLRGGAAGRRVARRRHLRLRLMSHAPWQASRRGRGK